MLFRETAREHLFCLFAMVFEVIQWHASPGQALHVQDKSSGNSQHVFRKCLVGWPCPWLGSHPDNCWHIV